MCLYDDGDSTGKSGRDEGCADKRGSRNALYEVDYEGVTGDISFDDNGDAIRDTAYLKQIQNGKFVFLKKQVDETE